jgi:Spy/CpxP family protein refolding chaperone
MKKFMLTGILVLFSIMASAALNNGDSSEDGVGQGKREGYRMIQGQGMAGGRMMEFDDHLGLYLEALALDEQQQRAIGEIRSRLKKETIRKMADISIARIELKEHLLQDPPDMKAFETKVKQLESLRTDMYLNYIRALEDIKNKLTSKQRKKLMNMISGVPSLLK